MGAGGSWHAPVRFHGSSQTRRRPPRAPTRSRREGYLIFTVSLHTVITFTYVESERRIVNTKSSIILIGSNILNVGYVTFYVERTIQFVKYEFIESPKYDISILLLAALPYD